MSEQISTTRISDLPENISIQSINTRQPPTNEAPPAYTQMNVHPNPYGISNQGAVMPPPQHTSGQYGTGQQQYAMPPQQPQYQMGQPPNMGQQNMGRQQIDSTTMMGRQQIDATQYNAYLPPASTTNEPQVRLPSRDIPMETSSYMQDEEIQPNYIPKPKLNADYLRDYEETADIELKTHKQKKHRESMIDTLLTEFQAPIFVAILFFIFQMPVVNSLLYKRLSFLPIYNMDGNINFNGLLLKSAIFGAFYYSMKNIIDYISSIAL
jgi:hypothetical protein